MGSRAVLGQAKLALRFQIPSQSSLHVIVKSHRSLTLRAALLFSRSARYVWNMGNENTGLRLPCQAGRRFSKASASSLASVFEIGSSIRVANQL